MRTSVDIPDELMKKAKIKAVEEGISLKELIVRGLKMQLEEEEAQSSEPWKDLMGSGSAQNISAEDRVLEQLGGENKI